MMHEHLMRNNRHMPPRFYRTFGAAFKDAEYASSIHLYKPIHNSLSKLFIAAACVILIITLLFSLSDQPDEIQAAKDTAASVQDAIAYAQMFDKDAIK